MRRSGGRPGGVHRSRSGFTLVMVLLLGAVMLIVGTTVFSIAVNNARTTSGERARTVAYFSAESALAQVRNTMGRKLLAIDDRGSPELPMDSGPFGLYRRGGQYYLGYPRLDFDGTVLGMHDLMQPGELPASFEATQIKDRTSGQRWWVHQFGAVRWLPLSVASVAEGGDLLPVALRQVEVVGESGASGGEGRQAVAQTLRLAVNLGAQSVTRRPEAALAAVSVSRTELDPNRPTFSLNVASDQPSRIRFEGPVVVDTPRALGNWVNLGGTARVSAEGARDPRTLRPYSEPDEEGKTRPLNPDLFKFIGDREKGLLIQGGDRRVTRPGKIELDAEVEGFEETDSPGTLQLTVPFAELIGKAGTIFRKDFNADKNILNPAGERIYDAAKAQFDFNRARRGIFFLSGKGLTLRGQPFKVYTYKGQGTLVITGDSGCLNLDNASLVPVSTSDSLSVICALPEDAFKQAGASTGLSGLAGGASGPTGSTATTDSRTSPLVAGSSAVPPPGAGTTSTPGGSTPGGGTTTGGTPAGTTSPAGIRLAFSSAIPVTVLANARGVPYTVATKDLERDFGAPPNLPTTLKRLVSGVTIDGVSIPSGARAVELDRRNYVLARLSDRDEPQVLVSIGLNSNQQRATLQRETVRGEAQVVPLVRLHAQVFSNAPFVSEGSARVVGSVVAPAVTIGPPRYAPNIQNLLYGDSTFGLRVLFDAHYRRLPATVGSKLMTFRPRLRPEPFQPVSVERVDAGLWQRLNFDQMRPVPPEVPAPADPDNQGAS